MGKYFGTDGVRGEANVELTPELAFKLGRFGGYVLSQHESEVPRVFVGRLPDADRRRRPRRSASEIVIDD